MNDLERPVGQYYYANVYIIEIRKREEREGQKKIRENNDSKQHTIDKKNIYIYKKLNKMQKLKSSIPRPTVIKLSEDKKRIT